MRFKMHLLMNILHYILRDRACEDTIILHEEDIVSTFNTTYDDFVRACKQLEENGCLSFSKSDSRNVTINKIQIRSEVVLKTIEYYLDQRNWGQGAFLPRNE